MSSIRKSARARTLTAKVKDNAFNTTTNFNLDSGKKRNIENHHHDSNNNTSQIKKRKVIEEPIQDDKIDPVEKLLSYTNINNDFLLDLDSDFIVSSPELLEDDEDSDEDSDDEEDCQEKDIQQVDFTKILHDNIRQYCSNFKKSPMEIYSNPSFALLNKSTHNQSFSSASVVPSSGQQHHQVQRFHNSEPSRSIITSSSSIASSAHNSITSEAGTLASRLTSTTATTAPSTPSISYHNHNDVPFFRTVNFSGPSKKQQQAQNQLNLQNNSFDEYFSYGDEIKIEKVESIKKVMSNTKDYSYNYEDEDYISPTDQPEPKQEVIQETIIIEDEEDDESPLSTPTLNDNKMSFHWRQNHNNLNLALNDFSKSVNHNHHHLDQPQQSQFMMDQQNEDIYKILNKHSILTGKASEMISSGNFLINDFFI
ncbi:hypothetical protein DFJ63DRAFT_315503 [Scheffersomyces coipomensis]|uniref:uncharacterized protein n=1 Tax=Scheffersomyces coipomensis TaxID=1788519 RepID=UPI00315DD913